MEPRSGSGSETVRSLEPRLTTQLANEPPTHESVAGMAEILESAATELEANTNARSDLLELRLVAVFLTKLIEHVDTLMARAEVPVGPALDRVRTASTRLHELRGRVEAWFREGRRSHLRWGIRLARWGSLERARGVVLIGGDAVEDGCAVDGHG